MAGRLRLRIRDAQGEREVSYEGGVIHAGREVPGGLLLHDPQVSRQHGRFESRPDGWYYIDANSRNGSAYNGNRLAGEQPILLRQGDAVQIGGALATVIEIGQAASMPAPAPQPSSPRTVVAESPSAPKPPTVPGGFGNGAQNNQSVPPVFSAPAPSMPAIPLSPPPAPPMPREPVAGRPTNVGLRDHILHVGRAIDNDIVISNNYVSSYHLEVWPKDGGLMVKDLGSRNGTFINGQRITEQVVPRNAVIQLGPETTLNAADLLAKVTSGPEKSIYVQRGTALQPLIAGKGLFRIVGKEDKVILSNVDASVRAGQFVGIVGGSGAGKSTLMKVLNRYTPPERGTLFFARNQQGVEEEIGYVPQDDIIHRELPLMEALVLSALLRYPPNTPREIVEQRAKEVLTELGLSEHTKTLVSRLSGGQRKRASVALELMRRPRILVLDEPTSGLDPASGRRLIKLLRALADQGVGILLVTHAMENLEGVDTLCFLAPGGNLVFWGSPEDAMRHFGTRDLAEVFDLLDPDGPGEQKKAAVADWRNRFERSQHYQTLQQEVETGVAHLAQQAQYAPPPPPDPPGLPQWQLKGLATRYTKIILADRRTLGFLVGQIPAIILLMFFVFGGSALKNPEFGAARYTQVFGPLPLECQNNPNAGQLAQCGGRPNTTKKALNLLFITAALMVWCGTFASAREICKEAAIWERESSIGVKPMPYVLSKLLVLGGLSVVQAAVMTLTLLILFQPPGGAVALFGLIIMGFLAAGSGVALGLLVSSVSPTPERATALLMPVMIPQFILGGGIMNLRELGAGKWASLIISARWAYQGFGNLTDRLGYLHKWDLPKGAKFPLDGSPVADEYARQISAANPNNPAKINANWEMFDIQWLLPALALIVLTAIFTAGAIWILQRKANANKPKLAAPVPQMQPAGWPAAPPR